MELLQMMQDRMKLFLLMWHLNQLFPLVVNRMDLLLMKEDRMELFLLM
jgi:hypothetical protein